MGAAMKIEVSKYSADRFQKHMKRLVDKVGWERPRAVKYGAIQFGISMRARTRKSPKMRKIVKNPDPTALLNMTKAKLGVMKFSKGKEVFSPIYRGGEFGAKIRYTERNGVMLSNADGTWQKVSRDELSIFGREDLMIQNHKKRIIGRSGLAKKAWGWLMHDVFNSNAGAAVKFTRPAGALRGKKGGGQAKYYVHFYNGLNYAMEALKNGQGDVTGAMYAAAERIRKKIERTLAGAKA